MMNSNKLALVEIVAKPWLKEDSVRTLITSLLNSADMMQQHAGWRILASSGGSTSCDPNWINPLRKALESSPPDNQQLLLDAIAATHPPELRAELTRIATDEKRPVGLRMKALGTALKSGGSISPETFELLKHVLAESSATSARLEAARILASAKLSKEQLLGLASVIPALGPLELREMLGLIRSTSDLETGLAFAKALKDAISLASLQESEIRSVLSNYPPAVFEAVAPALRELAAEDAERRRKLESFPALVAAKGRPAEGRKIFGMGKGACTACHRIGEVGNLVGPNLSAIGAIRTERDLLESILFPSNTLARDYEAHAVETADGQSWIGVIRKSLPDAVVLADSTGQEHTVARNQIVAMQTLPTSLMPNGLDRTLTEEELLDLVAFLRSRK
jgi:putative heme-binding domain-containing protein